ncbi:MAG: hypothetical protein ABSA75_12375 [Candidatus Bathyarchaeia archaeon]|jgi:hypothetical protein
MPDRVKSKTHKELSRASAKTIEVIAAIEEKWAKTNIPDKQEVKSIKDYAINLKIELAQLTATQPKCWLLKENYDKEFSMYKAKVENISRTNQKALKIVNDFSHTKDRLAKVQNDIETLNELHSKNREFLDEWQENYFTRTLEHLKTLKTNFEQLNIEKIEGQEKLREEFEKNNSILDQLILSTHKWMPLEKRKIIIRQECNPPQWSPAENRKAEVREFVSRSECEKCAKQRRGFVWT